MTLVKERPDFGTDQIRSPEEIKVGDQVIPVYFKNTEYPPVTVVGHFTDSVGAGFLVSDQYGNLNKMFYTDKGLIPYKNGKWNPNNWLKRKE